MTGDKSIKIEDIQDYDEEKYQAHIKEEGPIGIHPDGCYWCGGNHYSDCCPERP